MASDRSQYNHALRKWDALHREEIYSRSVDIGKVAILCSDYALGDDSSTDKEELLAFHEEAFRLAYNYAKNGIFAEVIPSFTINDVRKIMENPNFSSIVTIGNGSLSSMMLEDDHLDWQDISEFSTHLKTGNFIQRHCGNPIRDMSVPLGTFALVDQSNVYAARSFLPSRMNLDDELLIDKLHTHERMSYVEVKAHFPSERSKKDDDTASL